MIKALSIMELFQVIKRYIRQSSLNFQKCYERDQNMRAGGRGQGPGAEGRGLYNRAWGRGPDKSNSLMDVLLNVIFCLKTIFAKSPISDVSQGFE